MRSVITNLLQVHRSFFLNMLLGFANEGRLRLQENVSAYPIKSDISEGRLRNAETIGAVERTTSSSATSIASEARHRLQEGSVFKAFQTASVEIPRKTLASQNATSVPNVRTTKLPDTNEVFDLSTSLRKSIPKLPPSKTQSINVQVVEKVNPFEGDDYDETKNPFANEEPSNPFENEDEYNDSLNPFTE